EIRASVMDTRPMYAREMEIRLPTLSQRDSFRTCHSGAKTAFTRRYGFLSAPGAAIPSERPRMLRVTLFSSRIAFSTLDTNSLNASSVDSDWYSSTPLSKRYFCETRYCSVPRKVCHCSLK